MSSSRLIFAFPPLSFVLISYPILPLSVFAIIFSFDLPPSATSALIDTFIVFSPFAQPNQDQL